MEIRKTYKFEYEKDGKTLYGVSTGFLPEYATKTLETIDVLYPSARMDLKRVDTGEVLSYSILKDGDGPENYVEVERKDPFKEEEKEDAE